MNIFTFTGTIETGNSLIEITKNQNIHFKFKIKENETNSAYVQLYTDSLVDNCIPVFFKDNKRHLVPLNERSNKEILSQTKKICKYYVGNKEFIWKNDFVDEAYNLITQNSPDTIYEVKGEFVLSYYQGKYYNNFNIKSIKKSDSNLKEFKMSLDLFYNNNSLDTSDKKNKFTLNAYIEQYSYLHKDRRYFPIQVDFITNKYDFKNPMHIDIIKHRKENLNPPKDKGWVFSRWECQYVKGAQLAIPPLETLPKNIQFEILNSGRDIKEYASKIIGEASEYILLTRPDNVLNENGEIFVPTNISNNEFESKIFNTEIQNENSFDKLAKKEAEENPFN